jgi:Tfp pilus assembly protein PilO
VKSNLKGGGGTLMLEAVAKTYRYLDSSEIASKRAEEQKKGRK